MMRFFDMGAILGAVLNLSKVNAALQDEEGTHECVERLLKDTPFVFVSTRRGFLVGTPFGRNETNSHNESFMVVTQTPTTEQCGKLVLLLMGHDIWKYINADRPIGLYVWTSN